MLRHADLRGDLLAALAGAERLVLLGDLLEMRHGPVHEPLSAAREALGEIGAAMAGKEVVLVPGNHDHALLRPWLERRGADGPPQPLALEEDVPIEPGDLLAHVRDALAPAELRVAYPGVWLREDVWATHGHYLDPLFTVPTVERLGAGVMRALTGPIPEQRAGAEDFERILAPVYAWVEATAQYSPPSKGAGRQQASAKLWGKLARSSARRPVRSTLLKAAFGAAILGLNRTPVGPLGTDVSAGELRRAGLRALGGVVDGLEVPAAHVLFGHTHRSGPWPKDDPAEWRAPSGARLWNTGNWVWEAAFVARRPPRSGYWPGAAIRLGDSGDPEPVHLLGHRTHADLTPAPA